MSNSGLTKYQDECLEILAEECGEIVVEKSKIFRFGAMVESKIELAPGDKLECFNLIQK